MSIIKNCWNIVHYAVSNFYLFVLHFGKDFFVILKTLLSPRMILIYLE